MLFGPKRTFFDAFVGRNVPKSGVICDKWPKWHKHKKQPALYGLADIFYLSSIGTYGFLLATFLYAGLIILPALINSSIL